MEAYLGRHMRSALSMPNSTRPMLPTERQQSQATRQLTPLTRPRVPTAPVLFGPATPSFLRVSVAGVVDAFQAAGSHLGRRDVVGIDLLHGQTREACA